MLPARVVQAPMAGVSTPQLAVEVGKAGGLGSLAVGHLSVAKAAEAIADLQSRSELPFNVNLFCHAHPQAEPEREKAWLDSLAPRFEEYGAAAPAALSDIYASFVYNEAMLHVLLERKPAIVSFHFGLPSPSFVGELKGAGIALWASATTLEEGRAVQDAGVDVVVAQGYEAGGHRGIFDPSGFDERLGTFVLTRLLATSLRIPVVAAGGVMDREGVRACLALGAQAVQVGTAFLDCPEAATDPAHRAALREGRTVMTRAISGRPARGLLNRFTEIDDAQAPAYPRAYEAGKALHAAARRHGESGYGAWWAGQGARLARARPAAEVVADLTSF